MFLAAVKQPVSQQTLANRQFRGGLTRDRIEAVRAVRRKYQCAQLAAQKRRGALSRTEGGAETGQAGQGPLQHTFLHCNSGETKKRKIVFLLLCTVTRSTLSFCIKDFTKLKYVLVPSFSLKIFDVSSHIQWTVHVCCGLYWLHYVFFLSSIEPTDKAIIAGLQKFYTVRGWTQLFPTPLTTMGERE